MSYLFVSALMRHKTPEEFVDRFLIPTMQRGAMRAFTGVNQKSTAFARTGVRQIIFYNPKRQEELPLKLHKLILNPNKKEVLAGRRANRRTIPCIEMNRASIAVNDADWDRLEKYMGKEVSLHTGEDGSTSVSLSIPINAFHHWGYSLDRTRKVAFVKLDEQSFDQLIKISDLHGVVDGYLTTLSFLTGQKTEDHYKRLMTRDYPREWRRFVLGTSRKYPYADFCANYRRNKELFRDLANISAEGETRVKEVQRLLVNHFEVTGSAVLRLARKVAGMLSSSRVRAAARKIPGDIEKVEDWAEY